MNTTATTTLADTSSSTVTPQPKRAKRLIIGLVGSAVLVAGGVTAVVVDQSHGPSKAPAIAPQLQQAATIKADRLLAQLDTRTAVSTIPQQAALANAARTKGDRLLAELDGRATSARDDVMTQIHEVTGVSAAAQQARTLLYHELRAAE